MSWKANSNVGSYIASKLEHLIKQILITERKAAEEAKKGMNELEG
jgi:hypothetical protein